MRGCGVGGRRVRVERCLPAQQWGRCYRMTSMRSGIVSALLASAALAAPVAASEQVTPERFKQLHALIKPAASEEKWAQIPWLASLWEARQQAAAEGKPILLWEMDGHPLGCV
jgi:hypothetical protein